MSRKKYHVIKLSSPADGARFQSYLDKPGSMLLVNSRSNFTDGRVAMGTMPNVEYHEPGSYLHVYGDGWIDASRKYTDLAKAMRTDIDWAVVAIAVPIRG